MGFEFWHCICWFFFFSEILNAKVEFMAEDELIEIVPNMRMEPLNLICVCFSIFVSFIICNVSFNLLDDEGFFFFFFFCRGIMVHFFPKWLPRYLFGLQLLWRREENVQFDLLPGCQLVSLLVEQLVWRNPLTKAFWQTHLFSWTHLCCF